MKFSPSTNGFYLEAVNGDKIPEDAVAITDDEYRELLSGQAAGKHIVSDATGHPYLADPAAPTPQAIIAMYEGALDGHLDAIAQQYRYRDRVTFALRAGYPGPYQVEGAAFGAWMDACNQQAYALLASVQRGDVEMPTIDEFIASLPEFVLP